jgi:P27 family predicted phage terminase small subunit
MARRNPHVTPTALKILKSDRRTQSAHGKLTADMELPAVPVNAYPTWPRQFQMEALRMWKRLMPHLQKYGLVTDADLSAFARYCQDAGEVKWLQSVLDKEGYTQRSNANGMVASCYWSMRNKIQDRMLKTEVEFGFTPASRSRVKVSHGADDAPKKQAWAGL